MIGMKNNFLNKVLQGRKQNYQDGFWDGLTIALNIVAIALNHIFGFGDKRLTKLEAEVQKLIKEMIDVNDPMVNAVHLEQEVRRIRGKNFVE